MINTDAEGDSERVKEDWFFLITVPVVSAYNTAELQESWISYPDEPFHLGKQGKLRAEEHTKEKNSCKAHKWH